MNMVG